MFLKYVQCDEELHVSCSKRCSYFSQICFKTGEGTEDAITIEDHPLPQIRNSAVWYTFVGDISNTSILPQNDV